MLLVAWQFQTPMEANAESKPTLNRKRSSPTWCCQSSVDSKIRNPSRRPEKLSYNHVVLSKHKVAVCNTEFYLCRAPLNIEENEWLEVIWFKIITQEVVVMAVRMLKPRILLYSAIGSVFCKLCGHAHAGVCMCVPLHPLKRCSFYIANKKF